MMIGGSWAFNPGGLVTYKSACIARLDSAGQVLWGHRFVVSLLRTYPQGMAVLPSGNVIYWVRSESAQGNKSVLIKIDPEGNVVDTLQLDPASPSDVYISDGALSMQGDSALVLSGFSNIISSTFTLRIDTALTAPQMFLHERLPGQWIVDQLNLDDGSILQAGFAASPVAGNCILLDRRDSDGQSDCSNTPCAVNLSTPDMLTYSTTTQAVLSPLVSDITSLFQPTSITLHPLPDCLPTAVETGIKHPEPTVFPNPAGPVVHVHGSAIERVELFDATGRMMLARSVLRTAAIDLYISDLPTGLYQLRVLFNDGWWSEKLIKE